MHGAQPGLCGAEIDAGAGDGERSCRCIAAHLELRGQAGFAARVLVLGLTSAATAH